MPDAPARRPDDGADPALRQRLLKRIALAGLAVAVLLGGLALIDRFYVPPPAKAPRTLSAELTSPAPPAESALETGTASAPAAEPVPEESAAPPIDRRAATGPVPGKPAGDSRPTPSSPPHSAPKPSTRPSAPSRPLSGAAAPPRQFVVQMGVFNDVDNARALSEKLKEAGVPSRVEARVQVGPFKSRAEADAARRKLIELGLQPGILVPVRK